MRKIAYSAAIIAWVCGACGASTGLSDGNFDDSVGSSTASGSTGGAWPSGGYGPVAGAQYATGGASYYATGGIKATGGSTYYYNTGGVKATGGSTYYYSTGGVKAAGGSTYYNTTGGKAAGGYTGTGGGSPVFAMKVASDGYATILAGDYTLRGYAYAFSGGSNTLIQTSYGSSSICASGVVAANSSYISYAGIGVDVNQSSAASGSTTGELTIDSSFVSLSFSNDAQSALRVQLNDITGTGWCYDITGYASPVTLPLTAFNTRCWDNSGESFKIGTSISSIQLIVPGDSVVDRKYSFCLYGVYFE